MNDFPDIPCVCIVKSYLTPLIGRERRFIDTTNNNGPREANLVLSPVRAAKVQASLRIRAVSPEPPLLAHTSSESRGTFRQKARSLAPTPTPWVAGHAQLQFVMTECSKTQIHLTGLNYCLRPSDKYILTPVPVSLISIPHGSAPPTLRLQHWHGLGDLERKTHKLYMFSFQTDLLSALNYISPLIYKSLCLLHCKNCLDKGYLWLWRQVSL